MEQSQEDIEREQQLHESIAEEAEIRDMMQSLIANPGWNFLVDKFLKPQIEAKQNEFSMKPLLKMDDAFAQEYIKAEVHTLKMLHGWPQMQLESAQEAIAARHTQLKPEEPQEGGDE